MIDVSDGLVQDSMHLALNSGLSLEIDINSLPLPICSMLEHNDIVDYALYGGDDYELCFTVSPKHNNQVQKKMKVQCTRIGTITADDGIVFFKDKKLIKLSGLGYEHFSTER